MIYVIREDEAGARLKLIKHHDVLKEKYHIWNGVPYRILGQCPDFMIESLLDEQNDMVTM